MSPKRLSSVSASSIRTKLQKSAPLKYKSIAISHLMKNFGSRRIRKNKTSGRWYTGMKVISKSMRKDSRRQWQTTITSSLWFFSTKIKIKAPNKWNPNLILRSIPVSAKTVKSKSLKKKNLRWRFRILIWERNSELESSVRSFLQDTKRQISFVLSKRSTKLRSTAN